MTRRRGGGGALVPAVLPTVLAVLALGTGPAAADGAAPGTEEDAPALARRCGQDYDCSFRIIPGLTRELTSAVVSVGNSAINCTDRPIDIYRTVVLESSTTDNIAGEISGRAALEGTIDNTTDVSGSVSGSNKTEITHTDITAPSDKGPNSEISNGPTVAVSGTATAAGQLKLSAKASFELAFKATYSHEWKRTSTETTQVKFTVKAGDELQFGMANAMTRTVGELTVGGIGKLIKNIVVDSPSSVNVSTVVAQTFSARDICLTLRPPGRSLGGSSDDGPVEAAPRTDGARPTGRYRLTTGGAWAPLD
ncbi:hypothetical protein SAMN05216371_0730 [Streptomyces sp. TLI_053]|uniref:hypothetical protein n=1 Tax=Streptomyces sp. TLI_053 TaxID=1855352 RepID=UPI000879CE92|nr:hypothetical protein [Streptomyces sp. TLI_053]SDS84411.1 hypothetical protein SAMN05216371_0730 [Streptomyces sp. TLI_053]